MKEILILGGTGAIGKHLVSILQNKRNKCVVTSRSVRKGSDFVEYVCGNAKDTSFLFPLLESRHWDAVVDFMAYTTKEFEKSFPKLLDNTNQYVFTSSARVYANSKEPLQETSPRLLDICSDKDYLCTDEYALTKARQEDLLINSGKKNWTIIRPYISFSENRLQLSCLEKEYWLRRILDNKTLVFSRDLADRTTTITYAGDVAKGYSAIIGERKALGETFHITNSRSYKWKDILDVYLRTIEAYTGNKVKVLFTDSWEDYYYGKWQILYDRLYDRTFDNSKINQFTKTADFKDSKTALETCLQEFIKKPIYNDLYWETEARMDRLSGEWTSISKFRGLKPKIKYLLSRIGLYH